MEPPALGFRPYLISKLSSPFNFRLYSISALLLSFGSLLSHFSSPALRIRYAKAFRFCRIARSALIFKKGVRLGRRESHTVRGRKRKLSVMFTVGRGAEIK